MKVFQFRIVAYDLSMPDGTQLGVGGCAEGLGG
jgi:hypothetical protein